MQGINIVNRLKAVLGAFTDDFSDVVTITSLTRSGSTITAATPAAHRLKTGDYVTIRGAKEPIPLTSITRVDNIVTVTSTTSHKLSDPSLYGNDQLPLYVELSGVTPSGYNGTFELLTVPNDTTFTFKITTIPATPATVAGYLLLEDFDGYNGYKQVTVTSTTAFTYSTTNTSLKSPAQGTLQMSNATRVAYAATPDRILEFYSENSSGVLKNWAFVVVGEQVVYKNDTVATDLSSSKATNESYFYETQQNFSIYLVIPSKGSVLGGVEADLARSYEPFLLLSLANYTLPSNLTEGSYQPVFYTGNETDDYIKAYYVHRFDFSCKGYIQNEDTIAFNNGVPLLLVDGLITDTTITYKPNFRV